MKNCIRQAFYEMEADEELDQFIRRQARDADRSISYVIRQILWEYKANHERADRIKHEGTVT